MKYFLAAVLAALIMAPAPTSASPIGRNFSANGLTGSVCNPQSICGWVRLGRTDMEGTEVHNCLNVYEGSRRDVREGIGNPNLTFSTTLVGNGSTFEIWGKWVNPTNQPQPLGGGRLFVTCQPGS